MTSLSLSHVPPTNVVSSNVASEQNATQMKLVMQSVNVRLVSWETHTQDATQRLDREGVIATTLRYILLDRQGYIRETRWVIISSGDTTTTIQCINTTVDLISSTFTLTWSGELVLRLEARELDY